MIDPTVPNYAKISVVLNCYKYNTIILKINQSSFYNKHWIGSLTTANHDVIISYENENFVNHKNFVVGCVFSREN